MDRTDGRRVPAAHGHRRIGRRFAILITAVLLLILLVLYGWLAVGRFDLCHGHAAETRTCP